MSDNDDVPAFSAWTITEGMSLRDWFAGQALASRGSGSYNSWEALAEDCYALADAMLREREQSDE